MYLITPTLSNNNLNDAGLNCLLHSIDKKILCLANKQYLNQIYGFKNFVDLDLYDDLCEYKEILLDKLMGCNCLEKEHLIYITSKVQRLVDTFC